MAVAAKFGFTGSTVGSWEVTVLVKTVVICSATVRQVVRQALREVVKRVQKNGLFYGIKR